MAEQIQRMLSGDITDLPAKESSIVRIFTSSTFTDTFEERNMLMRDIYPGLRTYCQQHGLEFQVVDMRWGIRDEASADHKTSELCIQEIKNCQRLTPGPNYVCFLGNKYGYRPFPYKIEAEEFELLVNIARQSDDVKDDEINLLLQWYLKDTNAIPAEYVLQPVTAKLLYYMDMREEHRDVHKAQREQWWQTFRTFQRIFRITSRTAGNQRKLSEQQVHKYFKSVTEDEIEHGILHCDNPTAQTLCYIREIEDIHLNVTEKKTPLYTDIIDGRQDTEAQEYLDKLKRQRVLKKLTEENVVHYKVPWNSKGINAADRRHQEYLETFCTKFESDIHRLIDRSLEVAKKNKADQSPLYKEVLHNAWFCRDKCSVFCGREEILGRAQTFLSDQNNVQPLVIFGVSGSGKTSIMAMIASKVKNWLGKNSICMFRFLGTSPDTSNILLTITNICRQIHEVFGLEPLQDDVTEDYSQLVRHFHNLLSSLDVSAQRPLVILLDSVDQLSAAYNAHLMNWLPKTCSRFIKIIVSVLPGYYDILPTIRRSLPDESCYVEVPTLSRETGHEILDAWLEGASRALTPQQREVVMASFDKCPQPLFLKLIFTEASQWSSHTDVSGISLGASVQEAIGYLFERLERKHGRILFSHALEFMTAARNGLTENELEDILSLDDDVIDDVYQYWDPPVEGVVRLPNLLWARVRHDIDEFLVERQADGKTVVSWYHRQFWECAEARYLTEKTEKVSRHALMCEYFLGTWGGGRKKHITLTRREKALPDADRQVSAQPLMFSKEVFNLRKLSELPYHLTKAELFDRLNDEVLFNFEWIYAKTRGQTLNAVLIDYEIALNAKSDLDIRLVQDTLVLASSNIKHDGECLATQLIGRLLAFNEQFPRIAGLVKQAYHWCYAQQTPLFVPVTACLISAGGPLITNLRGHTQCLNAVAVTRDNNFIVTSGADSIINIWNADNHDCLHTLKMAGKGESFLVLTHDDRQVVAAANSSLEVWDLDTGEKILTFEHDEKVTCLAATPDGSHVVTGCGDNVVRVWNNSNGDLIRELKGHEGLITTINITKQGFIISASKDASIRAWNLVSGESVSVLQGHTKPVMCIVVMKDERAVVSGSEDKLVKIWDLESRDCVTLKGHGGLVKCLAAMHDGKRIVSGSKDTFLKIWDLISLECRVTLKGHTDLIWAVTVSHDNNFIVSASKDDMLKVWRPESGECLQTLIGHSSWISCVAMTTDCKTIISGSNDKNVKLWNASGNEHAHKINVPNDHVIHHAAQPECVAMTTDGHWGVSGAKSDSLKIWNLRDQTCVHTCPASVACVTTLHSSLTAVTGSHDGTVSVWDCVIGECRQILRGHEGGVTCVIVTKEDSEIVSASADGTIRVRPISRDEEGLVMRGHSNVVTCVVIMNDGHHLVSGSKDTTVRLWDMRNGDCNTVLEGHKKDIGCLAVTSDNQSVVSGSMDCTLKVWSIEKHECIHTIQGYNDSIKCVGITNDDRYFIAGSHEGKQQLRMWDITSGTCVKTFKGHSHAVMRLALLPDHNMLISSSRDGTIKVWDIKSGQMINSFDFQSQVKYFDFARKGENGYSLIVVTKSGTVAILELLIPVFETLEVPDNIEERKTPAIGFKDGELTVLKERNQERTEVQNVGVHFGQNCVCCNKCCGCCSRCLLQ